MKHHGFLVNYQWGKNIKWKPENGVYLQIRILPKELSKIFVNTFQKPYLNMKKLKKIKPLIKVLKSWLKPLKKANSSSTDSF